MSCSCIPVLVLNSSDHVLYFKEIQHLLHSIAISCKSIFRQYNHLTKALEGQETDFLFANLKSLKEKKMLENEPESMGSKTRTLPLQYKLLHHKMFSKCHIQALNL